MSTPIDPQFPNDDELLERLISGEATAEDWAKLSDRERASVEALLRQMSRQTELPPNEVDRLAADIWRRIDAVTPRHKEEARRLTLVPPSRSRKRPFNRIQGLDHTRRSLPVAIAAALMLATGIGVVYPWRSSGRVAATQSATVRLLETHRGERLSAELPDGSEIILGPASRLSYQPSSFQTGSKNERLGAARPEQRRVRDVVLSGEAYFRVIHDAAWPFRVRSRGIVTEDRGTAFVVRAYDDDPQTAVIVETGSVMLRDTAARHWERNLTSGQKADVGLDGVASVRPVDASRYTAWVRDRFVFDNVPLAEVLAELSRWYDVDITASDSTLRSQRISVVMVRSPVKDLLTGLATIVKARTVADGRVIRLVPVGAESRSAPPQRTKS